MYWHGLQCASPHDGVWELGNLKVSKISRRNLSSVAYSVRRLRVLTVHSLILPLSRFAPRVMGSLLSLTPGSCGLETPLSISMSCVSDIIIGLDLTRSTMQICQSTEHTLTQGLSEARQSHRRIGSIAAVC